MDQTQQPNLQPIMPQDAPQTAAQAPAPAAPTTQPVSSNPPTQPAQSPQPPIQPNGAPPPIPIAPKPLPTWLIALIVVVVGIFLLLGVVKLTQKPQTNLLPSPTPTVTPIPTPIRTLSPFATTSAFMEVDTAVASYSAAVKAYNTNDPSLSPPVLDLNLGF